MQSRDHLTFIIAFIITIINIFLYYIGTMLTGYLYIYLHNTYTTALCEVCACACACACVRAWDWWPCMWWVSVFNSHSHL